MFLINRVEVRYRLFQRLETNFANDCLKKIKPLMKRIEEEQNDVGVILEKLDKRLGHIHLKIERSNNEDQRRRPLDKARGIVRRKRMFKRDFEILEQQSMKLHHPLLAKKHMKNLKEMMDVEASCRRNLRGIQATINIQDLQHSRQMTNTGLNPFGLGLGGGIYGEEAVTDHDSCVKSCLVHTNRWQQTKGRSIEDKTFRLFFNCVNTIYGDSLTTLHGRCCCL